ncbi:MAG: iron-sulfur cluster assembly scaffold protein [Steroidobacteraceae bacterium]
MSADAPRYSTDVLDLFRRLPHRAPLAAGAGTVASGEALALERGAWVQFEARLDGGRVASCAFRAWGCPHTLAAAARACAAVEGLAIASAAAMPARQLAEELEVPRHKLGRMLVVEDAMHALIAHARALQSR